MHFIKTSDQYTAALLRNAGLKELEKEDGKWVFVNEPDKLNYSLKDMKDCHKTNILCV